MVEEKAKSSYDGAPMLDKTEPIGSDALVLAGSDAATAAVFALPVNAWTASIVTPRTPVTFSRFRGGASVGIGHPVLVV